MENDTESFSPEQSLRVIQSMIDKTKNSISDKSFYFLLWGWLVFIGALLQFTLKVIVRTEAHPAAEIFAADMGRRRLLGAGHPGQLHHPGLPAPGRT